MAKVARFGQHPGVMGWQQQQQMPGSPGSPVTYGQLPQQMMGCPQAQGMQMMPQQMMGMPNYAPHPGAVGWAQAPGSPPTYGQMGWQAGAPGFAQQGQFAQQPGWAQQSGQPMYQTQASFQQMAAPAQVQPQGDPALMALMEELGIGPDEVQDFGWIAEYGMNSDALPPRWSSHTDPSTGRAYYSDGTATSWTNPLSPYLGRIIDIGRLYLQQPDDNFFEENRALLWDHHKSELEKWHGPFQNAEGRMYFLNSESASTSFEDPREETQFLFELETQLLDSLEDVLTSKQEEQAPTFGHAAEPEMHTEGGAEILTLDGPGQDSPPDSPKLRKQLAKKTIEHDHKSALQYMFKAAEWIHDTCEEELETQHLKVAARVEQRRKQRALGQAGGGAAATQAASKRIPSKGIETRDPDFKNFPLETKGVLSMAHTPPLSPSAALTPKIGT